MATAKSKAPDTTDTEVKVPITRTVQLSDDVLALMDKAVRAARGKNWCIEFNQIAGPVFGCPSNEVVDNEGYNCKGYDIQGYDKDGFDRDGWDREGFNSSGRGKDGYNRDGYDRYGFNRDGVDKDGKDQFRYDYDGWTRDGYDYSGCRKRATRDWYETQEKRPDNDFRYDMNGRPRPAAKKTMKEKLLGS